nr:MAG TPA: hypothetical protein [Caudoviricetes sp.]
MNFGLIKSVVLDISTIPLSKLPPSNFSIELEGVTIV